MAAFPERAKVVIVGQGSIVGALVAQQLITRGWGLERSAALVSRPATAPAPAFPNTAPSGHTLT
jgi:hypothetical protein